VCVLAGAKNFREIGDQAADLPQELLAGAGRQAAPAVAADHRAGREAIRTLLQALDAAALEVMIGCWLRALAAAGRLEHVLTAIAMTASGSSRVHRGAAARARRARDRPAPVAPSCPGTSSRPGRRSRSV